MIDAVRSLTGGAPAEALLGHPASYFVVRSLMWTAAIVLVFATIGVARYRLDDEKGDPDVCLPGFAKSELERERERESEIEAAIEQAFSAIAEAPPEGVRSASLGVTRRPIRNREAGSPRRS